MAMVRSIVRRAMQGVSWNVSFNSLSLGTVFKIPFVAFYLDWKYFNYEVRPKYWYAFQE